MLTPRSSFLRMIVSALGACALSLSLAACVGDASSEGGLESTIDEPALSPQMAADCFSNPTYDCCLSSCTDGQYYCNQDCKEEGGDVSHCLSNCVSSYHSCLSSCDTIYIHTPPW